MNATLTPAARERIAAEQRKRWAKGRAAAAPQNSAATTAVSSPQNGAQNGSALKDAQAASAQLEELMRKAMAAAGCNDVATFKRLPREEQNAFLAQARGADVAKGSNFAGGLLMLDPATVRRSPFNRKIDEKDPDFIDLVADVKVRGVLQNGVVRPVNPPEGKVAWEVVAGEGRWEAAKRAGQKFPAVARELSDTEAIEIQAIENMKRRNLNAMDEATKYEQLREAYEKEGLSKSQAIERIEEKTGKKPATIYERLSLTGLVSQVQQMVRGRMMPASHAGLLTKLKDPATQLKLAADIVKPKRGSDENGVLSFRETEQLVKTAVQREKSLAEWQRQADQFKQKGWRVLNDAENKKVFRYDGSRWVDPDSGFVKGDDSRSFPSGYKSWIKAMGKHAPNPVLARNSLGEPTVVYDVKEAMAAVDKNSPREKSTPGASGRNPEQLNIAKKRIRAKARRLAWTQILKDLVAAVEQAGDTQLFLRAAAERLLSRIISSGQRSQQVANRRGLKVGEKERPEAVLRKHVEEGFNAKELRGIIIESIAWDWVPYDFGEGSWQPQLIEFCAQWGVDPRKIEQQFQAPGK